MKYHSIARCGFKVSEIGLGCEGFLKEELDLTKLLDLAQEQGVNLIDLYSPDPMMRKRLGKALKGRRDQFLLQGHLCSIWKNGQYKRTRNIEEVKQGFEELLDQLSTDVIDIGMIH